MKRKNKFTGFTLFVACVAAFGGLLFGYNTSVISGAVIYITKEFQLNVIMQQVIVSIILIGALVGACFGGLLTDRLGRRSTLMITAVFFLIGTVIVTTAHTLFVLFIGRIIVGLAIGVVSMAAPLYIAEMADPKHRGALVSLNQLAVTLGILLAYGINYVFSDVQEWRSMFGFGLVPAALLFLGLFFIPETPSFLVMVGKKQKAIKLLKKILVDTAHSEVIEEPKRESPAKLARWSHLFEKSIRPALLAGIGISVFQQLTGINVVIYYAPRIFNLAGFESSQSAILATVGIGVINVIMTIIALWLIDMIGRKPLLKIGITGMLICLAVLGTAFHVTAGALGAISIISLMAFVAFFAIGLGPVAWLIISEIYPMGVRGRAMGIATFANWTCNYIVSLTFLSLINFLGTSGAFWFYSAICLIALWFVIKYIPETKGKDLEDIHKYWLKKSAKKK